MSRGLMVSLFGFCMMGCVAEGEELEVGGDLQPPPEVDAPAEEGIPGIPLLGPTYTEQALSQHGGGGGTYTGHVTPAAVIYAVRVRSDALVDNISFAWYQPTRADNYYQYGNATGVSGPYGGTGGIDHDWWTCPPGKGVIGIRGNSGSLVDRIGVICGNVNNPDPFDPLNAYSPLWGGGGGTWFDDRCSAGRLVDSFNLRSARLVDMLQAICINAH